MKCNKWEFRVAQGDLPNHWNGGGSDYFCTCQWNKDIDFEMFYEVEGLSFNKVNFILSFFHSHNPQSDCK